MVKLRNILLILVLLLITSCDTFFNVIIINDLETIVTLCRYSDYGSTNIDINEIENIILQQGEKCVFSFFGPSDPYMLDSEQIEMMLVNSIIFIEFDTRKQKVYSKDWKKNINAVYDSVNKNWSVKLSDIINF